MILLDAAIVDLSGERLEDRSPWPMMFLRGVRRVFRE